MNKNKLVKSNEGNLKTRSGTWLESELVWEKFMDNWYERSWDYPCITWLWRLLLIARSCNTLIWLRIISIQGYCRIWVWLNACLCLLYRILWSHRKHSVWMVWGKRQCDWNSMTNSCNRHFHCWTSWRHICHFCRPRTGSQKHEHLSLQKTPYFMWLTDNCRIETKTIHEKFRTH